MGLLWTGGRLNGPSITFFLPKIEPARLMFHSTVAELLEK
jgi:hypothetical protein